MKSIYLTIITTCAYLSVLPQQEGSLLPANETEQQLENLAQLQEGEPEDDSYLQGLFHLRKNKLNLNHADGADLVELRVLSPIQIQFFLHYRRLLGRLVSIYELQAVPAWDVTTIQKVLPFITIGNSSTFQDNWRQSFTLGEHTVLIRTQQVLEKSEGFSRSDSIANRYFGSPLKTMFRYKYNYRNLVQFGLTGEKDAGEQFFKGYQKQGFDFYSFHLFVRKLGIIKMVALGDYTVNLGQGLIQWQSLAFKKSADITAVKRQAEILRPYSSAGEFNFMRGAGVTFGLKHLSLTIFGSSYKLDGSLNIDSSQQSHDYITSFINTGYHRTNTELSKKKSLTQNSFGGNISFGKEGFHLGLNAVSFGFSVPVVPTIEAYNQYSFQGNKWYNYSLDYSYTYRNLHFFGEVATDKKNARAFVGGLLASLDAKVDASLVYRNIEKSYQTIYGNAFTENASPTNEKGLFTGLSIRPAPYLRIDAYADVFNFPWLRYRVDAPTSGSEYLLQLTYKPNKKTEFYTRFRNENKGYNSLSGGENLRKVYNNPKRNWRTHFSYIVSPQLTYSQRVEVVWYDAYEKVKSQQGFLLYADARYKSKTKGFGLISRIQYFETEGFDSRLYAYESDVLYSFSIPQFAGKGFRYYFNCSYDVSKKMTVWLRWSQTIYSSAKTIGSGLDVINGNKKSEIKLQALYSF